MDDPLHPHRVIAASHHRQPDIRVLRRRHLPRHDADHGVTLVVQRNCLAEHSWIAIECALPKPIANDDNRRRANFIFIFAKRPANLWRQFR